MLIAGLLYYLKVQFKKSIHILFEGSSPSKITLFRLQTH